MLGSVISGVSVIFLLRDAKSENGATTGSAIVHLRNELGHMRRRHAGGRSLAEFHKKRLQFVGSGNDDPHTQDVQFKKQTEGSEVAIKKGVFVVPFGLDRNAIFVIVNVMSRGKSLDAIGGHFYIETLFSPTPLKEKTVYRP